MVPEKRLPSKGSWHDHRVAVVEDLPLQTGKRHHQRLSLMGRHVSEAFCALAEALHPEGAVRVQHDLDDVRLREPSQDLLPQLTPQLFSKSLGGFGARTHRPRPSCRWPFCCWADSPLSR
jgi:hypothetical protein